MKMTDPKEMILMHGPSFDGSGEIVERRVTQNDAAAYRRAGYEAGPMPEIERVKKELAEITEVKAVKKTRGKRK